MRKFINRVIKILISSDLFFNSGWGLIGPVFAIFLLENVAKGNPAEGVKIAGFASLAYWGVKSFLQIPIGHYLDKNHGEKDDFWFMVLGMFLTSLIPFGFIFASRAWHIYGLQALHGIGMSMALVSWCAIFTRHIDKGQEAFEWGVESTALGFGAGIAGAVGGLLAAIFGFKIIFILVGLFSLVATVLLLLIRKDIAPTDKSVPRTPFSKLPSPY